MNPPVVLTRQGPVRGHLTASSFFAFQGIPYAKQPVGSLRFQPPELPDKWSEELQATEEGPPCLQYDPVQRTFVGSEACLTLSVYTRAISTEGVKPQREVMVWIPGGAPADYTYNPNALLTKDIVLVTINYRTGILGFLSTGDEVLPGNNGLKDQVMALLWVKENISAFGGNPNCVTIFGSGSGGVSVHMHMISPLSRGLFHRAIAQSGVAVAPWAIDRKARSKARRLGEMLGCPSQPSSVLVESLRAKDATDIVQTFPKFVEWLVFPLAAFGPVVERSGNNKFLTDSPWVLFVSGEFARVPFLTGFNRDEGEFISSAIMDNPNYLSEVNKSWDSKASLLMDCDKNTAKGVRAFYFNDQVLLEGHRKQLTDAISDRYFIHPVIKALYLQHSHFGQHSNVYLYQMTGRSSTSTHASELQFLFGTDEEGEEMRRIIVDFWTNFAKTGNPTPPDDRGTKWLPTTKGNFRFMSLELPRPIMRYQEHLPEDRIHFWNEQKIKENM